MTDTPIRSKDFLEGAMGNLSHSVHLAMTALAVSCSANFSGQQTGFGGGTNKKVTPTPSTVGACDPKIQTCVDGKPVNPGTTSFPNGLDTSTGSIVGRNVRAVFFSGNGPGSCGGDTTCVGTKENNWSGPQSMSCPSPAVNVNASGMQGDCFSINTTVEGRTVFWQWPNYTNMCQGNRTVCSETGTSASAVTTHLKFSDKPCSDEIMLDGGPAGQRYHVLGNVVDNAGAVTYVEKYLCRNVKAAKDLKSGDELVTEMKFQTPGQYLPEATACDSSATAGVRWEEVGIINDCVKAGPYCKGFLTVCQKKEKITF